jgi:superfamily I DNA/RNA helicase
LIENKGLKLPYRAVIVDEAQDLSVERSGWSERLCRPARTMCLWWAMQVKGLEFEHVLIAGANRGIVPLEIALASADDEVTKRNAETGERALLYVALTRAKRSALVTAYGEASPHLSLASAKST